MESQTICDVSERPRYKLNKHPFVSLIDYPLGAFSQIQPNVLHIEDVRSYMHSKFESIGDGDINKDLNIMCSRYLTLKLEFTHLNELNLIKYIFYTEFDNHKWSRIILSRVHEGVL